MSSSHVTYFPHPEDPSLVCVSSKHSRTPTGGDSHLSITKFKKISAQNEKFREKLDLKEKELAELREKNNFLDHKMNMLVEECTSISNQKITELSKTNRHLNAQLSSQRTRCRELESKVSHFEKLLFDQAKIKEKRQLERAMGSQEPSEIQQLNDELERTKKKLFEASNQNHQLKNDLKVAQKCLQREIGTDANISQIIAGNTNWRGRAEQIALLQSKLSELKEKFDSDFESYEANRIPLKRLESVRRMEIESMNKELDDCKTELEDVKQKLVALKTRNKNLGDDLNNYKLKTLELMEKSKNDDNYIQCLNEKISMTKFECDHKINEMEKEIQEVEKSREEANFEVQKLHCHIENLNATITQKENQIACLKSENEELENNLRNVTSDFLFSCRDMSKESYVDMMNTLEDEKKHLLEMMRDLNERCNKASIKENEQHEIITKQKTKIARLESKIKEFESEKEAIKNKHRRAIRISEYSRSMSGSSISRPASKARERSVAVDSLKIKLESAMERIQYLENKLKMQNEEHEGDFQKFIDVLGKSKEKFQEIFGAKGSMVTESTLDSTMEDLAGK